ncbi:hypothetical protein FHX06_007224 [Rhizobium sp. BK512]|nr:hypothetical protein [Rhizobium sp. BK512]
MRIVVGSPDEAINWLIHEPTKTLLNGSEHGTPAETSSTEESGLKTQGRQPSWPLLADKEPVMPPASHDGTLQIPRQSAP